MLKMRGWGQDPNPTIPIPIPVMQLLSIKGLDMASRIIFLGLIRAVITVEEGGWILEVRFSHREHGLLPRF